MGRLTDAFTKSRGGLVNIVFAPFVAVAVLVALVVIGFGMLIQAVGKLTGLPLNGGAVRQFGVKILPNFYF